ncbi:MAG TPA: serine--tRNA ligase [Candidatus Acidoferrales bacterium]|nr:serine--tRNA ligase [Candidatus Acidoferrales bacterium]
MIDLSYFREHLDDVERMLRNRNARLDLDEFRRIDTERRQRITSVERLKAERNKGSEEVGRLKKSGQDAAALMSRMKQIADEIKSEDEKIVALDEKLRDFMLSVPNIPHSSVPVGSGAEGNVEVRRWGAPPKFDFAPKPHWELGEAAGILDLERAVKIAGTRFALYRGAGARLERALANFFLDVHTREQGYTEVLPPFIVNTASLIADGKLPKFAGDMFHLENTDLWLTTTAETELTNLHRDETLDDALLPIKVCAWTACFRSEAGAAGKDTRGIKRQHQFQKVEMFKFTRPEESYDELEKMVRDAEELLQQLGLHYRVMQLCTGDMGFASSKTYDIEVWVPSSKEFMEISSCSNCEAFQARRAGIRYRPAVAGKPKGGAKNQRSEFVHTLNGSGLPTGRTWIAVVENFQRADGSIVIPEALRRYMGENHIPAHS